MVNREFTNLFGYTAEETSNKIIDDLIVPEEAMDEAMEIEKLALQRRK